ncbi:hypothetical protein B0G84_5028 [Paraburkholderia sp. BL8N3]|nr:hypothetical protein [Paraburkholderia sp. BL8N3]TCK39688.1 hypothetical protein B0G84_5028 [Paraburkholderia sp. BL8N3]
MKQHEHAADAAELSPCPFCGGGARHLPFRAGYHPEKAICDTCKVSAHPDVWNRRAALDSSAVADGGKGEAVGWRLVPVKHNGRAGLTDAMMRAFYDAFDGEHARKGSFERLNAAYNAMINAAPQAECAPRDAILKLVARHAEELEKNDYAYFELAYTRRTGWMAWICSNHRDDDPNRTVLARGQGDTAEAACTDAIEQAVNKGAGND